MNKIVQEVDPIELVSWSRFDLMFKYLFALSLYKGWQTNFYRQMYEHHLKVWNNFSEYDNPAKNSADAFVRQFKGLLNEISIKGFDRSRSLIPLKDAHHFLNGAHRVAACLLYGRSVYCRSGVDKIDGQFDCSWEFFKKLRKNGRIDISFADRAALEFAKLKKNSRLVILYPRAVQQGRIDDVKKMIRSCGGIFYDREIYLNDMGACNLMRELYYKEEWAERNNGAGYKNKADLCFVKGRLWRSVVPVHVFLVDFDDVQRASVLKDEIRKIYEIDKHSVHINDYHSETIRIAQALFNQNSVHFLNHFNGKFQPRFEELLGLYRLWQENLGLETENYCITAGAVLSAYGVKECKDIDYLHFGEIRYVGNPLIQSHNDYGQNLYHTYRDDIIFNPQNHFYRYGVKFASLDVVKKLKKKRKEKKDFLDLFSIYRLS